MVLSLSLPEPMCIGALDASGRAFFCVSAALGPRGCLRFTIYGPGKSGALRESEINSRLCAMGGFNPDEWELPPKPKWMRWRTYKRAEEKFDGYEAVLEEQVVRLAAKFVRI